MAMDRETRTAIVELWVHSDRVRGAPFRASSRFLQRMWGTSYRVTEDLLGSLIDLGLVSVIDPGDRSQPRVIQCWRPGQSSGHPERQGAGQGTGCFNDPAGQDLRRLLNVLQTYFHVFLFSGGIVSYKKIKCRIFLND